MFAKKAPVQGREKAPVRGRAVFKVDALIQMPGFERPVLVDSALIGIDQDPRRMFRQLSAKAKRVLEIAGCGVTPVELSHISRALAQAASPKK